MARQLLVVIALHLRAPPSKVHDVSFVQSAPLYALAPTHGDARQAAHFPSATTTVVCPAGSSPAQRRGWLSRRP
jgi:hypothetical protein